MELFFGRTPERLLIKQAIQALLHKKRLSATVIALYGMAGIGKTRLLQDIMVWCQTMHVPCITDDTSEQAQRHVQDRVEQRPLVLLFDHIDGSNEPQMTRLALQQRMVSPVLETLFPALFEGEDNGHE